MSITAAQAYDRRDREVDVALHNEQTVTPVHHEYRSANRPLRFTHFLPKHITLKVRDGRLSSIRITGPAILKSGQPGEIIEVAEWYGVGSFDQVPEWAREILNKFRNEQGGWA